VTRKRGSDGPLLRRILRLTGNWAEAEDCLQSAYVRMAERQTGPTINDPAAYLARAAHNIAIDRSRRRLVRAEEENGIDLLLGIADANPLQDEVLIARERLARVRDGLATLPEKTRVIFLKHRLDGMKYREIALEYDISVSAVEKHIAKAMFSIAQLAVDG